jgi:hypothetical protein
VIKRAQNSFISELKILQSVASALEVVRVPELVSTTSGMAGQSLRLL